MAAGHVFLTRPLSERAMERLDALPVEVRVHPDPDAPPSRDQLLAGARGASALITLVTDRVDGEVLDAAGDQLEIVANVAVGYDNIRVDEARQRGVTVTNTPDVLTEATADLTFGLILSAARRIAEADRWLRTRPAWIWGPRMYTGLDVSAGATLGIIGFGRIGRAVARRARAFNMHVLARGSGPIDDAAAVGVRDVDLDTLVAESDVVSLHCPMTESTRHIINRDRLASMKPEAILVNAARGPLVDEQALVEALRDGQIAYAALDVFEDEPKINPGLYDLDNVVIVPHIGSAGAATRDAMAQLAIDNVELVLDGQPPRTPVT